MGTVQGGVLAAIADAAMGWAYMTTLGEGDKLVAHAVSTCMTLRDEQAAGR
jgi:acyl-coenzyme A thioesterase PaaI-like protein